MKTIEQSMKIMDTTWFQPLNQLFWDVFGSPNRCTFTTRHHKGPAAQGQSRREDLKAGLIYRKSYRKS